MLIIMLTSISMSYKYRDNNNFYLQAYIIQILANIILEF